jgi:squalene-hopene/tetraprenyl-beta-curcumene cyclase
MTPPDPDRLRCAYIIARDALLAERTPEGHWLGELSTSALSTAVAISALSLVGKRVASTFSGRSSFLGLIDGGLAWLAEHQNADGGWGDTICSFSNISTTMLCRAALHICGAAGRYEETLRKSEAWLAANYGRTPAELAEAVRQRYGKDRTFSVPILMTSALAGLVEWREVPSLPFELACFPQSWYRWLGLPVVSYALPALVAIGQAVYHNRPPWNPVTRLFRRAVIGKSLKVLTDIQPSNGGFLEAAPLTAFVTMGLASSGKANHPVVKKAVEFLVASVRPDGSWPIDTNLSTWVTTLAINALAAAGDLESLDRQEYLIDWVLRQQYRERHPYTGADPGAWAWTPLPGGVPDADDTPGAMLALQSLFPTEPEARHRMLGVLSAINQAQPWLYDLQNRDGGWPTFCRGWGKLPFDRSGADLTAHALRALSAWDPGPSGWSSFNSETPYVPPIVDVERTWKQSGLAYLAREQRPDGSWLPLWFGNQHAPDDSNPTYGTAKVLAAYRDLDLFDSEPARRGIAWLLANQNDNGGWGGGKGTPSSIEETALTVEALLGEPSSPTRQQGIQHAVDRGLAWLIERVEAGGLAEPTPIGFYFAKLWYFEKLYPIIFTVAALGRACRNLTPPAASAGGRTPHTC